MDKPPNIVYKAIIGLINGISSGSAPNTKQTAKQMSRQ